MTGDAHLYARTDDPGTSHAAARELEPASYWVRVVTFLAENDRSEGWTAYEIDQALPGRLGLCSWHRISDVRRKGWAAWALHSNGRVITRPGPSSRHQNASRVTPEGWRWLGRPVPEPPPVSVSPARTLSPALVPHRGVSGGGRYTCTEHGFTGGHAAYFTHLLNDHYGDPS
jgi:hypothetical protein